MMIKVPFGYDYDEKKDEFIINKKEANIVRKVYDLSIYGFGGYVADLLNGDSVYEIISKMIMSVVEIAQRYDEEILSEFTNEDDIIATLEKKENIDEKIIKVLENSKCKIRRINSSIKIDLLNDIDTIVNILNNLDNVLYLCEEKIAKTPEMNKKLSGEYKVYRKGQVK